MITIFGSNLSSFTRKYAAEIAHNVSSRTRKVIIERAEQLHVKILNATAKLTKEETA